MDVCIVKLGHFIVGVVIQQSEVCFGCLLIPVPSAQETPAALIQRRSRALRGQKSLTTE